jgi:hypothetical protein
MAEHPPLRDYSRSRAVLLGTSNYTHLPRVPAAGNSLTTMADLLTGPLCGWSAAQVTVLRDESSMSEISDQLVSLFVDVSDVALFYYVGHGLVDDDDQLCLGLVGSRTESHRRHTTSLPFEAVRRAILRSPARTKILILDCCFSGLTTRRDNTLGPHHHHDDVVLDLTGGTGAYTMAASSPYQTAWFETDPRIPDPHTYFTRHLASLIETGLLGQPSGLRLHTLFNHVRETLARKGLPKPVSRNIDSGGDFIFARNASRDVGPPPESRDDGPPTGGDRDGPVDSPDENDLDGVDPTRKSPRPRRRRVGGRIVVGVALFLILLAGSLVLTRVYDDQLRPWGTWPGAGEFFGPATEFPAVVFSASSAFVILYWVFVLLGGFAPGSGGFSDTGSDVGRFSGFLAGIGLGGLPGTIAVLSMIDASWTTGVVSAALFDGEGESTPIQEQVGVAAGLLVGALACTWLGTRLLCRLLPSERRPSRDDCLGRECVIRTTSVGPDFGQAEVTAADGSHSTVQVRQDRRHPFKAGSRARIVGYAADGEFLIAPLGAGPRPDGLRDRG